MWMRAPLLRLGSPFLIGIGYKIRLRLPWDKTSLLPAIRCWPLLENEHSCKVAVHFPAFLPQKTKHNTHKIKRINIVA